jgi:rod shape-determining protein MreC
VLKRPHYLAIGGTALLLLALLNLPASVAERLKLVVSGSFLPLFGLRTATHSFLDRASFQLLPRSVLIDEIVRARQENADLSMAAMQGKEAMAENARLRAALSTPPRGPWNRRFARVIGRDATTWWRTLRIDLGSRDGLQVNQVVLTASGLVGRVSQVGLTHADVALVGDAECGVSVTVRETRDLGIIKPGQASSGEGGLVEMSLLQNSPEVMAGQTVITSGLGGIFPAGIPVGSILDSRATEGGLFTTARIRLAVQLNRLEEVWVLQP